MNSNQTIKDRIKIFIKYKNIGQGRFEVNCGLSNGYINNISKGIGVDKMQRILCAYPELNQVWLMTGEGEMLKTNLKEASNNIEMPKEVFDRITQLIDTVCSQQSTIGELTTMVKEQNQTIDRLSKQPKGGTAPKANIAKCAGVK